MDSTFSFCDFLRPKKQKLGLTKIFLRMKLTPLHSGEYISLVSELKVRSKL